MCLIVTGFMCSQLCAIKHEWIKFYFSLKGKVPVIAIQVVLLLWLLRCFVCFMCRSKHTYRVSWVCSQLHAVWKRPTGPERSLHRAAGPVPLRSPRGAPLRWAADWSWARLQSKAWGSRGATPNIPSGPGAPQGQPAGLQSADKLGRRMLNRMTSTQSKAVPGGPPPHTKSLQRGAAGRWTPESGCCPENGCRRPNGLQRVSHQIHGSGESASHCPAGTADPGRPSETQRRRSRTAWRRKKRMSSSGWAESSCWAGGWPFWQQPPGCSPADCCCNWPSRGCSGEDRHSDGQRSGSWTPRSQQMCCLWSKMCTKKLMAIQWPDIICPKTFLCSLLVGTLLLFSKTRHEKNCTNCQEY